MILRENDEHFNLHKIFQHLTVDFEDWDEKTDAQKQEAWKNPWWVIASGFFNLF